MATRLEVYGLFLVAVLLGGGATAYAASGDTTPTAVESPTPTPTQIQNVESISQPEPTVLDVNGVPTNDYPISEAQIADNQSYDAQPQQFDMTPYIGTDPQSVQQDGVGHICGWTSSATSGWSYSATTDPCYSQFRQYVSSHCESNDGVVAGYICEGWFQDQLQTLLG